MIWHGVGFGWSVDGSNVQLIPLGTRLCLYTQGIRLYTGTSGYVSTSSTSDPDVVD